MSSADARRSCHCSDYALWFDLFLLRSCCITMAAGGSSPALAAPVVRVVVDSLPALAAPESDQLRFTLTEALQYRRKIYARHQGGCPTNEISARTREVAPQLRKKGNAATHYYRKIFTSPDGTPLISSLDFSHVRKCKIIPYQPAASGGLWEFRHDERASFSWRALVAVGLTDAQLLEFLSSPITSVKLMPACHHQPSGGGAVPNSVTWSWIFEREDGTWIALEPGFSGMKMELRVEEVADHPRQRLRNRACARSWEIVWENRIADLHGGLEDDVWRRHMSEELSSGRFRPEIDARPHGWCDNNPIAKAFEKWLLWEFATAMGNPHTQDLPPIQIRGATAALQPPDTHMHASPLADSEEELVPSSGSESDSSNDDTRWYTADGTVRIEGIPRRGRAARAIHADVPLLITSVNIGNIAQWQDRTLVTSPSGSIEGWRWQDGTGGYSGGSWS